MELKMLLFHSISFYMVCYSPMGEALLKLDLTKSGLPFFFTSLVHSVLFVPHNSRMFPSHVSAHIIRDLLYGKDRLLRSFSTGGGVQAGKYPNPFREQPITCVATAELAFHCDHLCYVSLPLSSLGVGLPMSDMVSLSISRLCQDGL